MPFTSPCWLGLIPWISCRCHMMSTQEDLHGFPSTEVKLTGPKLHGFYFWPFPKTSITLATLQAPGASLVSQDCCKLWGVSWRAFHQLSYIFRYTAGPGPFKMKLPLVPLSSWCSHPEGTFDVRNEDLIGSDFSEAAEELNHSMIKTGAVVMTSWNTGNSNMKEEMYLYYFLYSGDTTPE